MATDRKLLDAAVARLGRRGLSELDTGTIIVIPSLTFPPEELRKIDAIEFYEERLLFVLLMLARPELRIVYVTSHEVDPAVLDYYFGFLRDAVDARRRAHLLSLGDRRPKALTEKLLERPDVMDAIRGLVDGDEHTYILPFNVTSAETTLSDLLGVPIYGAALGHAHFGSKSGARRVAAAAGIAVPDGYEDIFSMNELEAAITDLRARRPDVDAVVIKLNNGFSGQGNAIVHLRDVRSPLEDTSVTFCSADESWPSFARKIRAEGAIVEELIRRPGTVSPSVQLRIAPDGTLEAVSTHDQILGGPDDQVYLGCRFPADPRYRLEIQRHGLAVAEVLARAGVIGSLR